MLSKINLYTVYIISVFNKNQPLIAQLAEHRANRTWSKFLTQTTHIIHIISIYSVLTDPNKRIILDPYKEYIIYFTDDHWAA